MAERVGYVVVDDQGSAMQIGDYGDGPRGGVLLSGAAATLFKSRGAAQNAIERSREYSEKHRLTWRTYRYRIFRLVPMQEHGLMADTLKTRLLARADAFDDFDQRSDAALLRKAASALPDEPSADVWAEYEGLRKAFEVEVDVFTTGQERAYNIPGDEANLNAARTALDTFRRALDAATDTPTGAE
jgi:hypothetical protein